MPSKASISDSEDRITPLPSCDNPTYESSETEHENEAPLRNGTSNKNQLNNKYAGQTNLAFDKNEDSKSYEADPSYNSSDPLEDLRKLAREISPGVTLAKMEKESMSDLNGLDGAYPVIMDSRNGRRLSTTSTDKRSSGLYSDSRPSSFYGGAEDDPDTYSVDKELGLDKPTPPTGPTYFGYTTKQWLCLTIFGFANVFSLILINLQAPFYPQVALEKGATQTEVGFVFGSFELVVFVLSPILGNYMDRLGPKRVFNIGILVTGSCSVLFGFLAYAEDRTLFITLSFIIRIIEAAGAAAHVTASFTLIAIEFPENVFTVFAAMETCSGVGLILGPLLGSILYDAGASVNHEFQFLLPFVTLGGILFFAAVLAYFIMPIPAELTGEKPEAGHGGFFNIIKVPAVALAAFSIFSAAVSIGYNAPTLEPHIKQFELTSVAKGCIFIINGGTYAIFAPIVGRICDRSSKPKPLVLIGAILILVGYTLVGPAPFFPFDTILWVMCIGLFIQGLGLGCAFVASFTQAMKGAILAGFPDGVETYGLVAGLWMSMFALGNCVGPSAAGVLVDAFDFRTGTVFVMALQLIVAGTSLIFILRDGKNGNAEVNKDSELEIHAGNGVASIQAAKFFSEFSDVPLESLDTDGKKKIRDLSNVA